MYNQPRPDLQPPVERPPLQQRFSNPSLTPTNPQQSYLQPQTHQYQPQFDPTMGNPSEHIEGIPPQQQPPFSESSRLQPVGQNIHNTPPRLTPQLKPGGYVPPQNKLQPTEVSQPSPQPLQPFGQPSPLQPQGQFGQRYSQGTPLDGSQSSPQAQFNQQQQYDQQGNPSPQQSGQPQFGRQSSQGQFGPQSGQPQFNRQTSQ
ncbi:hypothetical protein M1146_07450, partial [Patescibacteria group bacterium]|nr:hypothetical protein [Patescibacteria group bacterium]